MNEAEFLSGYDPASFCAVAVTVDVVPLTFHENRLRLLAVRRTTHPERGRLALPGTFVRADETLDVTAQRALREKAGFDTQVEQFGAFGALKRDPRMRIISVAYMALATFDRLEPVLNDDRMLLALDGSVARGANGRKIPLAFDHAEIVGTALSVLRRDLDSTAFSFGLLPPAFSLRELQQVHEAIRGQSLNKPAFRKRLVESGRIEPTGIRETDKGYRPAELYRVRGTDNA
ncbi:NUDIX hydrolase [Sphingomonas sp. CFBP 13720]|uniref:NUDIX hydrolase n=1 Tax=Sphingomonas sp. CFBP 13720 TaxID=2775302 RepID=UPI00177FD176|nr:NUDIX domain-containing protein [Sphingomonas sp. CFBP 13720]MBD8676857.1 NUDIX hydrolase [Sphingomonas sp. CFBP 13720]